LLSGDGFGSTERPWQRLRKIKGGKGAIKWTRLLCRSFPANAVKFQDHDGYFSLPKTKAGALASWSFVRSVVNFASLPTLI
jgi:hypothetical protein